MCGQWAYTKQRAGCSYDIVTHGCKSCRLLLSTVITINNSDEIGADSLG